MIICHPLLNNHKVRFTTTVRTVHSLVFLAFFGGRGGRGHSISRRINGGKVLSCFPFVFCWGFGREFRAELNVQNRVLREGKQERWRRLLHDNPSATAGNDTP